ncbi:MAG: hypothetical protein GX200_09240 [Firmicutes bacterium]|nr:hypothetical protein [Bacillota bacterium]
MRVKALMSIMVIALAAWLVGGGTAAWFYSSTPLMSSDLFTMGSLDVRIEGMTGPFQMDEGPQPLTWTFVNTGTIDAYYRARMISVGQNRITWELLSDNQEWELQGEWWYYPNPVKNGESVAITLIPNGFCSGTFQLEVDAVQATNGARKIKWGF